MGPSRWAGYLAGAGLLLVGAWLLPPSLSALWWALVVGPVAVAVLLLAGSYIWPPPDPELLFTPDHPAHNDCRKVRIPDDEAEIPGILLTPKEAGAAAVCLVHGAGDSKTSFKWRLAGALLAEGLTVLTIDLPGHGDYRHQPLSYPEVLATIPASLRFLRAQPQIEHVGVVGISLGGAVAIRSLVEANDSGTNLGDALVVLETPIQVTYSHRLFYRELWNTLHGVPVLSLLRETTVRQIWQAWRRGGYRSRHTTGVLFELLDPLEHIRHLQHLPLLLVYSRRDLVAPPSHASAMRRAVPHATFIETKKASHVTLTLLSDINAQVAVWLSEQLS